jgi:cystathionine beta-lyase/cystathionine gamma-synthase
MHEIARASLWLADGDQEGRPANRYGYLMGFTTKGGAAAARAVLDALQLIWRATDLGRIKSVATIPAISTHQQQGEAGRTLASIPANLIRLSIGGEDPRDIIEDLDAALRGVASSRGIS